MRKRVRYIFRWLRKLTIFTLVTFGALFIILLLLSLTTRPFFMHHRLGTGIASDTCSTEAIVVFGASGIPSGESLVRLYYAAQMHKMHPHCAVHICMVGDTAKRNSTIVQMANELTLRGVDSQKVYLHGQGKNTRGQVLELAQFSGGALKNACLMVVTSPTHMRRCLLSLKKEGFNSLVAVPAFEIPLDGELLYNELDLGGKQRFVTPKAGQSIGMRYEIWTQMNYLLICAREYSALAYYWLRGWI